VGVAISADGKRVYALIEAKVSGLYRSDNGGDNWTLQNSDSRLTSRPWYFNSVTIDPANPDVLYIPNIALYRSDDGGKTISILRGSPGGDDYHQLWVDPRASSELLLASDQGTTLSIDGGKSWSTLYNQPTAQFYHVVTDNQFPYMLYGAAGFRQRRSPQPDRPYPDHGTGLVYHFGDRGWILRRRSEQSEYSLRQ
jgi:photosystem II stability/assembly factor-like uncharacterized protein